MSVAAHRRDVNQAGWHWAGSRKVYRGKAGQGMRKRFGDLGRDDGRGAVRGHMARAIEELTRGRMKLIRRPKATATARSQPGAVGGEGREGGVGRCKGGRGSRLPPARYANLVLLRSLKSCPWSVWCITKVCGTADNPASSDTGCTRSILAVPGSFRFKLLVPGRLGR